MTDYEQQALDFAKKHGVTLVSYTPEFKKHFPDDITPRWVFPMLISRNGKDYKFKFGQSIASGAKEPTMYDVLSCLEKYAHPTFEDFCSEYGYDTDSRTAERTYKAVQREYKGVERLFSDIMDELREIQ